MSTPNPKPQSKIRIVASYTTIPSRYDVLEKSMKTMVNQTRPLDAIYLGIPELSRRLNKPYPSLPESITSMCTVVKLPQDYGPICKICGALWKESDPDTLIISCDDDVLFEPNFVEKMLEHHFTRPDAAICGTGALIKKGLLFISMVSSIRAFKHWSAFTGFTIPKTGRKVDLIFGVAGVLYLRKFFPKKRKLEKELLCHCLQDDAIFHNDDVLISSYLSKQGIERYVFYDIPTIDLCDGADALSGETIKMLHRMIESIANVKALGFFPQMEEVSVDETPAGRSAFAIIIILLVIFLIILYWRSMSDPELLFGEQNKDTTFEDLV
jgi:hypothetical protein